MKEHLFFIETNLQPVEAANIREANVLKQSFEQLLAETISYANGVVSEEAIKSNEFVTPYTLRAEELNSKLTGASLDTGLTKAELQLVGNPDGKCNERLKMIVWDLNARSLNILREVIEFQKRLLALSLECKIFISLYDEMLEHDTREAIYYRGMLEALQEGKMPRKSLCNKLDFWNNIMGEHAEFIDGMLDPTERSLKESAESFAKKFEKLVEECIKSAEKYILERSLDTTEGIINYKRAAVEGLLECKIKSIIPPLLADHVLREANHYLRLLKSIPE